MKWFLKMQIAFAVVGSLIQFASHIMGGPFNATVSWQSLTTILIGSGFLWIHKTITGLKVTP